MKTKKAIEKEKEKIRKIKELRKDLQEKLEEQIPSEVTGEKIRVEVEKVDIHQEMEPEHAKAVIEALLFASSKPLTPADIRKAMHFLSIAQIKKLVKELQESYLESKKSFEIIEIAGGYEISTRKEYAPWICRVEMQKKKKQATQSALETLAILAYKQPLTRAEIEELRGVDVSGVLSNLSDRGFVKIVGKKEIPGRPFLYGTTEKFLEHFGLNTVKDLPDIAEIQTLVDQSIRKEELLGTQKMVDMPGDDENDEVRHDQEASSVEDGSDESGSSDDPVMQVISAEIDEYEDDAPVSAEEVKPSEAS